MTKTETRKLSKGVEIFNTDTGEVASFVWSAGTPGNLIFVEGIDREGRHHIWFHHKVERV